MNDLLTRYDDFTNNFSSGTPTKDNINGNVFSILGENHRFISGTYEALLKRPELFGSNAITFLYALDIGQTFRKDSLFSLFESFLQKPPSTTEANVLFLWAHMLMKYNTFINFEPTFEHLNKCIAKYMDKKTFLYNGKELTIETFKPFLYNSAGVNLIELIPYIAYIFTYHVYGFPLHFSDAYSSSSLKSYLTSLEGWFSSQYMKLYSENDISILNANMKENEIDDKTWKDFYSVLLDSKKIVQLRNAEIEKTADVLNQMIDTQQSINEVDLYKRYDSIINQLVNICIKKSPLTYIYKKVPKFDAKYYNVNDLVNLTAYMISESKTTHIIDTSNYFKYVHCEMPTKYTQILYNKPELGYNKLSLSFNRPFSSGDIVSMLFQGYVKEKFKNKKEDILDDDPLYITPSDVTEKIYQFLMPFFVTSVWELEHIEMYNIINNMKKELLQDLLNIYNSLKVVYGETFGTTITAVYSISFINEFAREHCDLSLNFSEFNPFVYLKHRTPDMPRIYKLRDMMTSMCYIMKKNYVDFINEMNVDFYKLFTSQTLILQPYIQGIDNDVGQFALGGIETYEYLRYSNPFTRGYGFLNNVVGSNEELDIAYQYLSQVNNETIIDIVETAKDDLTTISNNIQAIIKKSPINVNRLYKYEFSTNSTYKLKESGHFLNDKYMMGLLLKYSCKQTVASNVLEYEQVRVKSIKINSSNELEPQQSTLNGYKYGSGFIDLKLNALGSTKYIPVYSLAAKIDTRNLTIINPNGLRMVQIITPSTGKVDENSVYWIYTASKKESSFSKVALKKNAVHPTDAEYMLADRVSAVYSV